MTHTFQFNLQRQDSNFYHLITESDKLSLMSLLQELFAEIDVLNGNEISVFGESSFSVREDLQQIRDIKNVVNCFQIAMQVFEGRLANAEIALANKSGGYSVLKENGITV